MLARQTFLYLPAQIAGPFAQFVAAIVWTYWLTPEEMGGFALIWSIQELAGVAVLAWWSGFVQRYASAFDQDGRRDTFEHMELVVQFGSAAAQVLLTAIAVIILFAETVSIQLFVAAAVFSVIRNAATHFAVRARAQGDAAAYTINVATGAFGGLAFGIFALQIASPSLEILLWAYSTAQLAGLVASFAFMRIRPARPVFNAAMMQSALRFGSPAAVSSGLVWVGSHAIRFVVEVAAGRAAVGLMTVGWWLGLRLASFAGALVMGAAYNVAIERMRVEGPDAARAQLSDISIFLLGLLAPMCVGGWLLATPLAMHLVDADYRDMTAAILLPSLIAGALRVFQDSCVDAGFLVFERPSFPALISAVDAITTLLGCAIGIWIAGIPGAAWGCAAGALVTSTAGFVTARKVYGFGIRVLDIAKLVFASAVMAVAVAPYGASASISSLVGAVLLGAVVYAAVILALFPKLRALRPWIA